MISRFIQNSLAHGLRTWLRFWLPLETVTGFGAFLRIVVALSLLYSLFLYTLDFNLAAVHLAPNSLSVVQTEASSPRWSFSLGHLWQQPWKQNTLHGLAIFVATALLLGVATPLSAPLALLAYVLHIDAAYVMATGYDSLLIMALLYLIFLPCGKKLSLQWVLKMPLGKPLKNYSKTKRQAGLHSLFNHPWHGIGLRLIQLHVCGLHFYSGLRRLHGDWFAQELLWRPLLHQAILPNVLQTLLASPRLSTFLVYGLCLLELFFGVFIWLKGWRYWVLALSMLAHLCFGILFGPLAFNLLLMGLMLSFLPSLFLERVVDTLDNAVANFWELLFPGRFRRR